MANPSAAVQPLSGSDYRQKKLKQALLMKRLTNFIPIIGTVVLAAVFFITCFTKGVDVTKNLQAVIKQAMIVGFLATGATFIFAIGSFDLSLGANMLVSAALGATVYNMTGSLILMLAVCIASCVLMSLLNAALASVFVMTIAMMSVFSAISSLIISSVDPNGINTKLSRGSNPDNVCYQVLGSIWFQLAMLVLFVLLCGFLFNYMKMGRRQKFIGGNPICARLTGIAPMGITIFSFVIAGVGIGLAAFFTIMQDVSISSSSGGVGMNMLIAIVFGGMAISGGPRSKALAAFIGGFSMAFLDQFMQVLLMDSAAPTGYEANYSEPGGLRRVHQPPLRAVRLLGQLHHCAVLHGGGDAGLQRRGQHVAAASGGSGHGLGERIHLRRALYAPAPAAHDRVAGRGAAVHDRRFQLHPRFGYDYRALQSGQKIAVNTGANEYFNCMLCYVIAGAMAGLAGFLFGAQLQYTRVSGYLNFGTVNRMFDAFCPLFFAGFVGRFINKHIAIVVSVAGYEFLQLAFGNMNAVDTTFTSTIYGIINSVVLVLFLIYLNNENKVIELVTLKKFIAKKREKSA